MKHVRTLFRSFLCQTSTILMIVGSGCSHSSDMKNEMSRAEIESKLNGVLHQMVSRCAEPEAREALQGAEIFRKLQGLSMDIVGFSVPINSGSNHAHISFTLDHFQRTPLDTLAIEGLKDFHTATTFSRKKPNG
jgi:hypothetical protein